MKKEIKTKKIKYNIWDNKGLGIISTVEAATPSHAALYFAELASSGCSKCEVVSEEYFKSFEVYKVTLLIEATAKASGNCQITGSTKNTVLVRVASNETS